MDVLTFSVSKFYGKNRKKQKRTEKLDQEPITLPLAFPQRISGPTVCWKTFYRQKEAFKWAQQTAEDVLVFAFEKDDGGPASKVGKRRYLVTSLEVFWHYYRQLKSCDRHHYEVIPEGCPCKLYFDLEFLTGFNSGCDGDKMVDLLIQYVCKWLQAIFDISCDRSQVLDLDASTENKFSRHLIFHLPGAVFDTCVSAGNFVRHIFKLLVKFIELKSQEVGSPLGGCDPNKIFYGETNCFQTYRRTSSNDNFSFDETVSEDELMLAAQSCEAVFCENCNFSAVSMRSGAKSDISAQTIGNRDNSDTSAVRMGNGANDISFLTMGNRENSDISSVNMGNGTNCDFSVMRIGNGKFQNAGFNRNTVCTLSAGKEKQNENNKLEITNCSQGVVSSNVCDNDDLCSSCGRHLKCCVDSLVIDCDTGCWSSRVSSSDCGSSLVSSDNCGLKSCRSALSCDGVVKNMDIIPNNVVSNIDHYSIRSSNVRNIDNDSIKPNTVVINIDNDSFRPSNVVSSQDSDIIGPSNAVIDMDNDTTTPSNVGDSNAIKWQLYCNEISINSLQRPDVGPDLYKSAPNTSSLNPVCCLENGSISFVDGERMKADDGSVSLVSSSQVQKQPQNSDRRTDDSKRLLTPSFAREEAYLTEPDGDCPELGQTHCDMLKICGQFSVGDLMTLLVCNKNGSKTLFCDLGVYTKNRNFRLYLSSKLSKNNPLKVSSQNQFRPDRDANKISEDQALFNASLISHRGCAADVRVLHFGCQKNTTSDVMESTSSSRCSTASSIISQDSVEGLCCSSPYPEIDGFIESLTRCHGYWGRVRHWTYFRSSDTLLYDIVGCRWCGNVQREHRSNNIMYLADLGRGVFYQKCYDPDCQAAGYKSEERNIPHHLLPSTFLELDEDACDGDDELLLAATQEMELEFTHLKGEHVANGESGDAAVCESDDDVAMVAAAEQAEMYYCMNI